MQDDKSLLKIDDLTVSFKMYDKGIKHSRLEVIHELSLSVNKGEIMAVVGSSGSGKSLLAHAVMGILPPNAVVSGKITFDNKNVTADYLKEIRGSRISFIPQSVEFLDPLMTIDRQVIGINGSQEKQREIFKKYDLSDDVGKMYPFQLSGGMARRVLIAGAVINKADLIIADEPTPGLSTDLAMETMKEFRSIADNGCGILLITHDIDTALKAADRIAVVYAGTIVEIAKAADFIRGKNALRHPYSRAFIDALPQNEFKGLDGFQPYAGNLPKGCLFSERCPMKNKKCCIKIEMRQVRGGEVRCVNAG